MKYSILLFAIFSFCLKGLSNPDDSLKLADIPNLDMSFVNRFDSLLLKHFEETRSFTNDTSELNFLNLPMDSFPQYLDEDFTVRLQKLDEQTPIDLVANKYSIALIKYYAYKRRRSVSKMLAKAQLYFPLFEEELLKRDMPLELKYLPIVESALNPKARSRSGAEGLWQFMPVTGKSYGLKISSYVDERRDPIESTEAACEYLKKLHSIYGDWSMALAAYNAGPGTVNKAIRRSGGKTNYWALRSYLPKETQSYVPAFIAVNYVMNYASFHNIYPQDPPFFYEDLDTMVVTERVEFEVLEQWLHYNRGSLKYLNPKYKRGIVPKMDEPQILVIPRRQVSEFIDYKDSIYLYSSLEYKYWVAANTPNKKERVHIIQKGESMESIASKYKCEVQDLKAWNNKTGSYLRPGSKLYVYIAREKVSSTEFLEKLEENKNVVEAPERDVQYHTVRKGDTLWDIARRYEGVSVDDIKRANNLRSNNLRLGTKLIIQ